MVCTLLPLIHHLFDGGNIFGALEDAAMMIIRETTNATSDVMGHKFGDQAREVTRDTLGIGPFCMAMRIKSLFVGVDVVQTGMNLNALKPKKLAKRLVLHTVSNGCIYCLHLVLIVTHRVKLQ